jgi:hypothetical protein
MTCRTLVAFQKGAAPVQEIHAAVSGLARLYKIGAAALRSLWLWALPSE